MHGQQNILPRCTVSKTFYWDARSAKHYTEMHGQQNNKKNQKSAVLMQQYVFRQDQKEAHNMSNYPLKFWSNTENHECNLDEPGVEFNSLAKSSKAPLRSVDLKQTPAVLNNLTKVSNRIDIIIAVLRHMQFWYDTIRYDIWYYIY